MLKHTFLFKQFRIDRYKGPLPTTSRKMSTTTTSSSNLKQQQFQNSQQFQQQQQQIRTQQPKFVELGYVDENTQEEDEQVHRMLMKEQQRKQQQQQHQDDDISLSNSSSSSNKKVIADAWMFQPKLLDCNRFPTSSSSDNNNSGSSLQQQQQQQNFSQIDKMLLPPLATVFQHQRSFAWNTIKQPTQVQDLALSVALQEHRDVCLIAPTASGKTLCYALPAVQTALEANGILFENSDSTTTTPEYVAAQLQARDSMIQNALGEEQEKGSSSSSSNQNGSNCRYCGLNMKEQRICPQTGAPHPPISMMTSTDLGKNNNKSSLMKLKTMLLAQQQNSNNSNNNNKRNLGEPFSLILCPTAVLVEQVHRVIRSLHCGLKIALLRSVKQENLQEEMISKLLPGCDILVSTPGMCLAMLNKGRLSLDKVKFVAVDEIDHMLELENYDIVQMILSRLHCDASGQEHSRKKGGRRIRERNNNSTNNNNINNTSNNNNKNSSQYYSDRLNSLLPPSKQQDNNNNNAGDSTITISTPRRTQRMFVGATLSTHLHPLVSKMMHPNTCRWILGSILRSSSSSTSTNNNNNNNNNASQLQQSSSNTTTTSSCDTFGGITSPSNITHSILMVNHLEKVDRIRWLYDTGKILPGHQVVIFCNTKASLRFLSETLPKVLAHHLAIYSHNDNNADNDDEEQENFNNNNNNNDEDEENFDTLNLERKTRSSSSRKKIARQHQRRIVSIHQNQSEDSRLGAWEMFQRGNAQIMITTDMFSRGMDFQNVFAVIQYEFPHHFESFIHRAGRAGRRRTTITSTTENNQHNQQQDSGNGRNFAFFEPQDVRHAKKLVTFLNQRRQDVPPQLRQYANQSWTTMFKEQINGMSMRRFDPRNADARKSPLGLTQRRYPRTEEGKRFANANKFRRPDL